MKNKKIIIACFLTLGLSSLVPCRSITYLSHQGINQDFFSDEIAHPDEEDPWKSKRSIIADSGMTIETRVNPPEGFEREDASSVSFAGYLRKLPLKKYGAPITQYNGVTFDGGYHVGVINLPIGKKNLHQCADAIIRLRAEYFYSQKQYDSIHFNFTNGMRVDYTKWIQGYRIKISGNKTWWEKTASPGNTKAIFWQYLEKIFDYAGTLSLAKELKSKPFPEMKIGDVLIQGGSPGHAMLVVDMVVHPTTGKKLFMLAESYMPAQELHILTNDSDSGISPWYDLSLALNEGVILTPTWNFYTVDLKSF